MSSAAVGSHSGAGPLSLMSCVRESSPLHDFEPDIEKNVSIRKKQFWNPKNWFRRKQHKHQTDDVTNIEINKPKESIRSRSTSELSINEEPTKRRSASMQPGLSVSHDSVFHSPNSSSDMESDVVQSSSSLSISQPQFDMRFIIKNELSEKLRQRRGRGDTSEDDEGLPHSPCNSPTTTDGLLDKTAIKDLPNKSHSTCSDGSLLSMSSSEMDDESFSQSRHSSKLSLHDKRAVSTQSDFESDLDLAPSSSSAPLNHSGAHHRVAVRPNKRRAPHRNRVPQLSNALPTTPEVNEDLSVRSASPDNVVEKETIELYSMSQTTTALLTETHQLKCSSLPPGLVPQFDSNLNKLNRSRSNAGSKSHDQLDEENVIIEEEHTNHKQSFFERILPRKSGKKRKSKESKSTSNLLSSHFIASNSSFEFGKSSKPMVAPRSGAASRQRVQPMELPVSPIEKEPEGKLFSTSPLQAELESRFKQKQIQIVSKLEPEIQDSVELRNDEIRMKIPRLSSLQQKVLKLHSSDEADECGFKSLTDFSEAKETKVVTKSHSFKSSKQFQLKVDDLCENAGAKFENEVTVSGPSHTAIVNVSSTNQTVVKESVSVTKIQLKHETIAHSTSIPEFFSRHLNKVEKPSTNIVFSSPNSPRIVEEQARPKTLNLQAEPAPKPRKFSHEEMDIVEKETPPEVAPTPRFRKNTVTPESPKAFQLAHSISLESLKGDMETSDRSSSQDSLDEKDEKPLRKSSVVETVILRRKSQIQRRNEGDEPELMKVFARRSLKLKDGDLVDVPRVEEKGEESPVVERKSSKEFITLKRESIDESSTEKSAPQSPKVANINFTEKSAPLSPKIANANFTEKSAPQSPKIANLNCTEKSAPQSPKIANLNCTEKSAPQSPKNQSSNEKSAPQSPKIANSPSFDTTEVILRKQPQNNNFYAYARSMSVNLAKTNREVGCEPKTVLKSVENRKTENWTSSKLTSEINEEDLLDKLPKDEIICELTPNVEEKKKIGETKNFNQRKAEWEKRAQEASKMKTVP